MPAPKPASLCRIASLALAAICGCAAPQANRPVTIGLTQPSLAAPQALPQPVQPQLVQPELAPQSLVPPQPIPDGLPPRGPGEELPRSTPEGLTVEDLEHMALGSNPSLARAQAMVAAARGNWVQVGLRNNPAVGYLGQQLGSGGLAEQHAVMVDQEIITGGKRQLNRAEAEQRVAIAEQQLAAQQQRVLTDVRLVFYDALLAQQRLKLAQQLLEIAMQGQSAADRLQKAGETSRVDLIQSNLEVEAAEIEVNKAANQHTYVWMSLSAILGMPHMPPTALRGDLESAPTDFKWDETLARVLSTSPEIAAAMSEIERARWGLMRARRQVIPNVRFQGAVMQDNGIGGKTDGIVQVLVPLPLLNRNQGGIAQAQAEVVAAERAIQQLELDLQNRLAPVFERYSTAANQVRRYRERILPKADESLSLVRRGYEAGEFPYLLLLNSQRTYFQQNLQYLDSIRELRASSVEIEGLLLRDSLSSRP